MSLPKTAAEHHDGLDPEIAEQIERNKHLIAVLESWRNASEEERMDQFETWEVLKRSLDEDELQGDKRSE
jgi:hypothetical protein